MQRNILLPTDKAQIDEPQKPGTKNGEKEIERNSGMKNKGTRRLPPNQPAVYQTDILNRTR